MEIAQVFRDNDFEKDIYAVASDEKMILRDYLATDRTKLANQRTLLAYIRTALTLFVAGVSFVRFFGSPTVEAIGWAVALLGVILCLVGYVRYRSLRSALQRIKPPGRSAKQT